MMKPNSKQFKVTYKDAEAPVLVPVEYQMMREIGCSRSDLHKIAIREMHNRRQQSTLHFIWGKKWRIFRSHQSHMKWLGR